MKTDGKHTSTLDFVADDVLRIPLPLPLAELTSVNCYALLGTDGVTLIDPGWASADTEKALIEALKAAGVTQDDIGRILVTHSHWDHYTQAYAMSLQRKIPLLLGRGERHSIQAWADLDGAFPLQVDALYRAGADEHALQLRDEPISDTELHTAYGHPSTYLDGGETLQLGTAGVDVIATPGHTRGHLAFRDVGNGLLFTGDHVLPRITPSIAYERSPNRMALRSYLTSLELVVETPSSRMMPAHGDPQPNAHERARELLDHHQARLVEVHELVTGGASTGLQIASGMTWTRRNIALDDLAPDHQWTAVLEAVAHADLLVWRGDLVREADPAGSDNALETYRIAA